MSPVIFSARVFGTGVAKWYCFIFQLPCCFSSTPGPGVVPSDAFLSIFTNQATLPLLSKFN